MRLDYLDSSFLLYMHHIGLIKL